MRRKREEREEEQEERGREWGEAYKLMICDVKEGEHRESEHLMEREGGRLTDRWHHNTTRGEGAGI